VPPAHMIKGLFYQASLWAILVVDGREETFTV
jgi:hypothetical protein